MVLDPDGWAPLGPSVVYNGQMAGSFPGTTISRRGPVSGRVTAIAIDPWDPDNVIYVGTAFGGVWKTVDAGLTWRPLTDDHLSLSVGAMAIDKNPHRLYVAGGEAEVFLGTGMTIYDPALDTWAFKNDTSSEKLLTEVKSSAIIVDSRSAPNIRILIGADRGLIESKDNGATWTRLTVVPGSRELPVTDLAFSTDVNRLYVAIEGVGVYRQDGAGAFTALHGDIPGLLPNAKNLNRITLAMCRDNPEHLFALYTKGIRPTVVVDNIYRTKDGGATWNAVDRRPPRRIRKNTQAYFNAVLAVDPEDQNCVFFGEENLWRSKPAGERWSIVSKKMHVDQHALAFHPTNSWKIWAGNDGGVWFSKDGGDTWESRNRGLHTMQYYSLAQHPDQESILLAGSQDNGTQRFEGSPAWNMVQEGDGFFCAIDPHDPSHWYGSRRFVEFPILRSDVAGAEGSWLPIRFNIGLSDTTPNPFYVPFVLDPSPNSEVLYLGTTKLYRTDNRGEGWKPVRKANSSGGKEDFSTGDKLAQTITAICVHPEDPSTAYVGTFDGRVWHLERDNSSELYTVRDCSVGLPGRYIADIAVPSGTPATVYVAIGSDHHVQKQNIQPLSDRLFRSDDRGVKWKPLNLPPLTVQGIAIDPKANSVNAIVLDPDNPTHVYIGCDIGVFKSTESGDTWTQFSENLPNSPIADLQIHKEKRLLRAATMGRSIWERQLDSPVARRVGLYVRDNLLDMGRGATPEGGVINPLDSSETLQWYSGADIIVDTPFGRREFQKPKSTMTYTEGDDIDYIGFAQLQHHDPRSGTQSRVYVEAINRGPVDVNDVAVRVFYAAKAAPQDDGIFPNLPSDFWTKFPDDDPVAPSAWKPLGPKKLITRPLRPAEPQIVRWDWDVPASLAGKVALLAVITGAEDPLNEASVDVGMVARENNHVALRQVNVETPAASIVATILTVIRLAVELAAAIED